MSRDEDVFGLDARPDGIEGLQPVEEVGVLCGGYGAREGLVEVVVCVDQPGQHHMAGEVEHFVGSGRQAGGRPDLFDEAVADK